MNHSTRLNLETAFRRHALRLARREKTGELSVLDVSIGSADDTLREMMDTYGLRYTATNGGVPDDTKDESFDVVLSVHSLQSDAHFMKTVADMGRVCRRDGVIMVVVPSAGLQPAGAGDCWRFQADGVRALASIAGAELIDLMVDERGPLFEILGVFRPAGGDAPVRSDTPTLAELDIHPDLQNTFPGHEFPERELTQGSENYRRLLADMHKALDPRFYVEIGVFTGITLASATGPAVGIDPAPALTVEMPPNCTVAVETSDDYFARERASGNVPPIDYSFIDGMHLFEYVLMDFMNVERHASPSSVIVVDDVLPNHPAQAYRDRITQHWTGDVWKIIPILRKYRPDLILMHLDTSPTGLLFILGADPENRVLWNKFDDIIDEALNEIGDPPGELLHRHNAIDPTDRLLDKVFRRLRHHRESGEPVDTEYLRDLIEGSHPRVVAEVRP